MFVKKFLAASILAAVCLGDMSFKMPANITALKASDNGIFIGLEGVWNWEDVEYWAEMPKGE